MSEDKASFFIKKGIGRRWCSIYATLHLYFTNLLCKRWSKPASHSRQCQKPFSHFWHIFISRTLCPFSETLTHESPVSVALIPNSTRYRKEDPMCTSAVSRAWAFRFPPSHRMWNLGNFSVEMAIKCSIQTSGE